MKRHRYIDHDWQMTPIDFQVTKSKVKVTVTTNVFTQWKPLQLTAHMGGGMHVLQTALVNNSYTDNIMFKFKTIFYKRKLGY